MNWKAYMFVLYVKTSDVGFTWFYIILIIIIIIKIILWHDVALLVADDNNTRVLFEKVLSSMPKDKARFVIQNS